ncbi:O-antigen ligase domain-containing protein [Candidatus Accumulibacter phosphatis]|uniref:O-antigen ligase domain-containing protein n=1 Tax=Candidatus Accumulibacter phosphatis TaxID=327160 RepID=A0ABX1TXD6_9PROT|nr:O-antigen ligase family protein [Candidatus Accumulibacter phosphatis]NMQ27385.1 O-antigen ligase domain-containing protein [Candidatus Accumulibacter phosphatis]
MNLPLQLFFSIFVAALATLLVGYKWAYHIAAGNGQLALYILLLWVWSVNMPSIMAFDTSGITKPDMLNPQSISRITMFFLVGSCFIFNLFNTNRLQVAPTPRIRPPLTLPMLIFGWYLIDAFLVLRGQDLLLAMYRLAEWILLLFLIATVVTRAPTSLPDRENWVLRVVFPILLLMLLLTLILLPIAPRLVYSIGQNGAGRLGNPFAHPNTLGVLAGMAFFYFLELKPRLFRLGLLLSFCVMAATYSRGAWAGFFLATCFFVFLKPRAMYGRFFAAAAIILLACMAWIAQDLLTDTVGKFLARGGSVSSLATASERTEVWQASRHLIAEAPLLGHGYIAGPKKLNEIMASGVSAAYFRAVHAHNEFVQTQINGGVVATLLLVIFLLRTVYLFGTLGGHVTPRFFPVHERVGYNALDFWHANAKY